MGGDSACCCYVLHLLEIMWEQERIWCIYEEGWFGVLIEVGIHDGIFCGLLLG